MSIFASDFDDLTPVHLFDDNVNISKLSKSNAKKMLKYWSDKMVLAPKLSSDSMHILETCAQKYIDELTKLHWNVIPYLCDVKIDKNGRKTSTKPTYEICDRIAKEQALIEKAIKELHKIFEDQFEE